MATYANQNKDIDEAEQLDPNNLVSSRSEHRISDGQKRYKTLGKTTSSKYPRPKTLFRVFFEPNTDMDIDTTMCDELSKYVLSVDKPSVTYTTKQMNQYNRIKYVYDNIKYGTLKITFIDVKDNPIQEAFFSYMKKNNSDIKNDKEEEKYRDYYEKTSNYTDNNPSSWGLNINSNKKMFKSIKICEMFLDRLMVYKIENPVFKDINFGSNKIGDYSYNEIVVQFDVEGITNIYEGKLAIGGSISDFGGANLAHKLGMRWYGGTELGTNEYKTISNGNIIIGQPDQDYINQLKTDEKIRNAENKLQLKQAENALTNYSNYTNKTKYYWISDSNDYGRAIGVDDIGKLFAPRYRQLTDLFKF